MRIVVISSPKAGNVWLKCLLSRIYDLTWVPKEETPATKPEAVRAWVASGGFPDQSIFHQHVKFSPAYADALEATPAKIVTILRDPYDIFVSLHTWVESRATYGTLQAKARPRDILAGKPIDHPEVMAFLANEFGALLARGHGWLHSGHSVIVRYEGLHRDPMAELTRATEQIGPVASERITAAIDACRADNMRQMSEHLARHIPSAKVGSSRQRLSDAHLTLFREHHANQIRSLGYPVR